MPSAVAANMVFDRRKASIRSTTVEVVIALGSERLPLERDCASVAFCNGADADDVNAIAWRGGVQELVVFAVVERLFKRGSCEQGNFVEGGGDFRCEAEAVQVERESVANVDAGGRFAAELLAFLEARLYGVAVT